MCVFLRLVAESPRTFEGAYVLDELPEELGVVLWRCLRDVRLWALAPSSERPRLFMAGGRAVPEILACADLPHEVAIAAAVLADLPQVAAYAEGGILATACAEIGAWAAGLGAWKTATAFGQAAAFAAPTGAAAAATAGFTALEWHDLPRAETWLRRASVLSRHADRAIFAQARAALGDLYSARGDTARARSAYLQAVRATRGRPDNLGPRAQAAIGLYRLAVGRKDGREAERAARIALRALGRRHPEFLTLGRELAEHWLGRGKHDRALGLLKRLRYFRSSGPERVKTLTLLARAAAACGDRHTLRRAWNRVLQLVSREPRGAEAVSALVALVRGAGSGMPPSRAAAALHRASRIAQACGCPEPLNDEGILRYVPPAENDNLGRH